MAEINLDKIYASFLIRLEECNSNDDLNELNKEFLAKDSVLSIERKKLPVSYTHLTLPTIYSV